MKRDPKLVIDGYSIPGGVGRIAVAAAVDLIKRNPGVRQTEVQKRAIRFSGLNASTAGWITSPNKGPTGHLWVRRGSPFRCFPNEGTEQFNIDPLAAAISYTKASFADDLQKSGLAAKPGDIVQISSHHVYHVQGPFLFLGYSFHLRHRLSTVATGQLFTDPSRLDDPGLYGGGVPIVYAVGIFDGKQVTWPLSWIRAQPLGA